MDSHASIVLFDPVAESCHKFSRFCVLTETSPLLPSSVIQSKFK